MKIKILHLLLKRHTFIEKVLNKMPSKGKVLQGRCPDEVWNAEFKTKKTISRDALKLFCMRTTNNISVGNDFVILKMII